MSFNFKKEKCHFKNDKKRSCIAGFTFAKQFENFSLFSKFMMSVEEFPTSL